MNHKERVLAVLRHQLPDHIPAHAICIDDPKPYLEYLGFRSVDELYDYLGFGIRLIGPAGKVNTSINGVFKDAFGASGGVSDYSSETSKRPFAGIETVNEIENYNWPDADNWDYESFHSYLDLCRSEYAIMAGSWNPVFCQVLDLFGMEDALIELYNNPILIEAAVAHIEEFYMEFYKRFFKSLDGKADIFNMGDDFATQRGMLISPDHWRKYFKPTYKKIFELAKSHGMYVWFHSCGAIREVLPDLIDIGMDVWETVQVHLPGNQAEDIKKEFGKHITFFGAVNTQQTLPFGTPEDVRRETRERIRVLGKGGGYICGPDHHIKPDVPVENALALFDEIKRFRCEGCTL